MAPIFAACDMQTLLYPVPGIAVPADPPAGYEEVGLESAAGDRIHGWHLDAGHARAPAVVLFHGNGENLGTMARAGTLHELARLGVAVLVVDYPGYGQSSGRPSEAAILAAAEAALAWLAERHSDRSLVAMGWSLGAAVAIELAARHPVEAAGRDAREVAGLVALSPWTCLEDVARTHFPGWMVRLFLRERYDAMGAAARVRVPVVVIHGEADTIVPPALGTRLANAFPQGARLVLVPDTGHNDLLGRPEVWRRIREFLAQISEEGWRHARLR